VLDQDRIRLASQAVSSKQNPSARQSSGHPASGPVIGEGQQVSPRSTHLARKRHLKSIVEQEFCPTNFLLTNTQ
jgi:hypothetical protein